MEKYLNSKGRNIIGWDEILEGGLAPNATVMSWRGVEGGITAAKAGHDAIMTPSPYAYLDQYQEEPETAPTTIGGYNTLKKTYSYNPVPDDAEELIKKHIIGVQGNIWNEYMQNDERRDYQAFPRAVALRNGLTQNSRKDWNSFRNRMVEDFERMDVINVKACRNFFDVNINTHVYDGTIESRTGNILSGCRNQIHNGRKCADCQIRTLHTTFYLGRQYRLTGSCFQRW